MYIDKVQGKVLFPSKIACHSEIHTSLLSVDAVRLLLCVYKAMQRALPCPLFKALRDISERSQIFLTTGDVITCLQNDFVHFTDIFFLFIKEVSLFLIYFSFKTWQNNVLSHYIIHYYYVLQEVAKSDFLVICSPICELIDATFIKNEVAKRVGPFSTESVKFIRAIANLCCWK